MIKFMLTLNDVLQLIGMGFFALFLLFVATVVLVDKVRQFLRSDDPASPREDTKEG